MRMATIITSLLIAGCTDQSAQNKIDFEACVQRAENKYEREFRAICIRSYSDKQGECSYNIQDKNALLRSKDNEITACATMYAPKR